MAAGLIARLRWLRQHALGINRRNQDLLLRYNPPRLVSLVDHKLRTKDVLAEHQLAVPATYARCARATRLVELSAEMARRADFVLKPARGAGGEGIVVIAGRDGDGFVKLSGARLTLRDLLAHAADIIGGAFSLSQTYDEVLLEQRLKNHPALAPFCPAGVADLRVVLLHGVPVMAMLRLPTIASDGRANLHVGGIGVGIELASGRPCFGVCRDRPIERHPDTRQPLIDIGIPHWPEALRLAARAYDAIPLGFVGVDIVIDESLGPVILELNARPGLSIQLANRRGLRPPVRNLLLRTGTVPGTIGAEARVALGVEMAQQEEGAWG
ncbi:MAG TPA: sugar-transfer associated ATP-grasp domain-containing protein [Candidatus Kryptonia bacterium]|nr:sugar-transfer associated ATP-grasp domain-containing protein [Candidatus Kryptonia bacterium]